MQVPEAFWKSFGEALAPALKETSSLSGMGATEGGVLSVEDVITRFSAAMEEESPACVRLNPWKRAPLPILDGAVQVPWCDEGWRLSARPVYTLHPLFHAGAYYVQDASSMFVGAVLRKILRLPDIRQRAAERPLRVLDLCAAPGGKTTDAAASLRKAFGDGFELLANEYNPHRFAILKDNVEIWGDPQVFVCNTQAARLGQMNGYFDIIIVDAPCSGEGMFRKEPQAVEQWSLKKMEECAALQRSILDDIAPALAPSGYLIYSTCTYNTQENEGSVRHLLESRAFEAVDLKKLMSQEASAAETAGETLLWTALTAPAPAETPAHAVRLIPGLVHGEGQFCALLCCRKGDGVERYAASGGYPSLNEFWAPPAHDVAGDTPFSPHHPIPATRPSARGALESREHGGKEFSRTLFRGSKSFSPCVTAPRAHVKANAPAVSSDCPTSYALDRSRWPNMAVDKQTALNFLHGDSLILPDAPQGLLLLTYKDIPLGFVKNIGARCNNLHPKSRRIKMDVKQ